MIRPAAHPDSQRGAALISVMLVMVLLMGLATALITHAARTEADAVDASLADVRAHWAMMGHVTYMLSRVSQDGLCGDTGKADNMATNLGAACKSGPDDDRSAGTPYPSFSGRTRNSRVGSMQDYLGALQGSNSLELQEDGTSSEAGRRVWIYPRERDSGSRYRIAVRGVVYGRPDGSSPAQAKTNGQMQVELETVAISNAIPAPVIKNIALQVPRLSVGLCVVDWDTSGGTPGSKTDCTPQATTVQEGASAIEYVTRGVGPPVIPTPTP